jgi:hypothetical protein
VWGLLILKYFLSLNDDATMRGLNKVILIGNVGHKRNVTEVIAEQIILLDKKMEDV